jgi:hypothetical protein
MWFVQSLCGRRDRAWCECGLSKTGLHCTPRYPRFRPRTFTLYVYGRENTLRSRGQRQAQGGGGRCGCSNLLCASLSASRASAFAKAMAPKAAVAVKKLQPKDIRQKHFTPVVGDSRRWTCNYCSKEFNLSSSARAVQHLVPGGDREIALCAKAPKDVMALVLAFSQDRAAAAAATAQKQEDMQKASGSTRQAHIDIFFNKSKNEAADLAVAMFLYENGISFNVIRSEAWRIMLKMVAGAGPGYNPPGYNLIRTAMLDKAATAAKEAVSATACMHSMHLCLF